VVFLAVVFFFAVAMVASLQYFLTMNIAKPVPDELDSAPYGLFCGISSNALLYVACQYFFRLRFTTRFF
jgi:hypothetical protein